MLSVIVPVYNVESYLDDCLKSLINQDLDDYEIIVVDDGATDKSGSICDLYGSKYVQIHVYHKTNGGLSDARNYGLMRCQGDYVTFIDSDDWIEKNSLSHIYRKLRIYKPDIMITRLCEVTGSLYVYKDSEMNNFFAEGCTVQKALEWQFRKSDDTWPAQKNIYSIDFIRRNNFWFKFGILHEDIDWTARLFHSAQSFGYYTDTWYYHRLREGSIRNSIKTKNIIDVIQTAGEFYSNYYNNNDSSSVVIFNRMMEAVYWFISQIRNCPKNEWERVIEAINKNSQIFRISPGFKYMLFSLTIRLLGTEKALVLLSRINRKK